MKPIEHQFRQLAFAQVLLGLLAFCIAEGRPVLLGVVGALAVASWFVTEGPRKSGLDRLSLNLCAVATVALLGLEFTLTRGERPVALVGHFTMALQLLLLFSKKTRREYIQLAVLSPLQMIGASVLPGGVTLIYGLLLVAYCFVTLLTVLTFQLKSAGDLVHARHRRGAAQSASPPRPDQIGGAHLRLHFRASAALIGVGCGAVALAGFLTIPRTQQDPFAAALVSTAAHSGQKEAGFADKIHLDGGTIGGGSPEPVLNITLTQGGESIGSDERSWLVRGAVLDTYDPRSATWSRPGATERGDQLIPMPEQGLQLARVRASTREASITLRRQSIDNLFSVVSPGGPVAPVSIDAPGLSTVTFNPEDQLLSSNEALASVQRYRVRWVFGSKTDLRPAYERRLSDLSHRRPARGPDTARAPAGPLSLPADATEPTTVQWSAQADRVRALARRLLAARGLPTDYQQADADERLEAAAALAAYLRRNYRYTLDNPRADGVDPVAGFLLQTRAGHCELFASGLCALCRSVGIPARLATGYRASEYNAIGGYYIVRQSHAHAWTEVDLGPGSGWHVLDATPAAEVDQMHQAHTGWLGSARALYDHLEFNWIATVITYDRQTQRELLGAFGSALNEGPDRWAAGLSGWLSRRIEEAAFDTVSRAVALVAGGALLIAVISLVRLLVLRHRRMVALQLTALPRQQRRLLARQLRFYIAMLETLERHGEVRPHWQSPFQFAQTLADQAPLRYEPVLSLTEMFYEVRFGYRPLDRERQARVRLHLRRLEQNLSSSASRV